MAATSKETCTMIEKMDFSVIFCPEIVKLCDTLGRRLSLTEAICYLCGKMEKQAGKQHIPKWRLIPTLI
jgi:hypothetical protein